jgi:hypothetical protein
LAALSVAGHGIANEFNRNLDVTDQRAERRKLRRQRQLAQARRREVRMDAANQMVSHSVNNTDSSFIYDGQSRLVRIRKLWTL